MVYPAWRNRSPLDVNFLNPLSFYLFFGSSHLFFWYRLRLLGRTPVYGNEEEVTEKEDAEKEDAGSVDVADKET